MAGSRLDAILDQLRSGGGRITTARRAVVSALLQAHGHVNAEDLAAKVQADHPDVHQSTIYRILDDLERLGVVDHAHLGHGPAVYHLTDQEHHHLVCERCGAVVEVPDQTLAPLSRRLKDEYGFSIRPRHFAMAGLCRSCRA